MLRAPALSGPDRAELHPAARAPRPTTTRRLLLLAAADPVGDPLSVARAPAARDHGRGGGRRRGRRAARHRRAGDFRHPLVRSAVYRAAAGPERRAAHLRWRRRRIAESIRIAARGIWPPRPPAPTRTVARELERSAGRAKARGGLAAAAAFLQRAVALTDDPARRAGRALAAAQASLGAGAFAVARGLLATAEAGPLDEIGRARVDLLRAEIVFAQTRGPDAPVLLLQAARRLEPLDARLARDTYLDAWGAALFVGHLAGPGGSLLEVSRAAASAPAPADGPLPRDLLLDGLALIFTEGERRRGAGAAARNRRVRDRRRSRPKRYSGGAGWRHGRRSGSGITTTPSRSPNARRPARARLRGARGPRRGRQRLRPGCRVGRRL